MTKPKSLVEHVEAALDVLKREANWLCANPASITDVDVQVVINAAHRLQESIRQRDAIGKCQKSPPNHLF